MVQKNHNKTTSYLNGSDQLSIEYLHQKSRGISSFDQKNNRVSSFSGHRPTSEKSKLADTLGEGLGELMKALETLGPARALKLNHRSVTGWISGGTDHDQIQFESTLERDFAYLAMFDSRVMVIQAQPFTLQYQDKTGNQRTYTPDFMVEYIKAPNIYITAVVETKYKEDLEENHDNYVERFSAMEQWCAANDKEFHVLSEDVIRGTRIENVKALYSFKMATNDDMDETGDLGWFVQKNAPISIKEILNQKSETDIERARVQHNIWYLIGNGRLWVNLDEPITYDTLVYAKPIADTYGIFFSSHSFAQGD